MNTPDPKTPLDADELMHLAAKAVRQDHDAEAIAFLERAIALSPNDGKSHYLLGAIYASTGMSDRAVEAMTRGVALAPEMSAARFQLGLLHLTRGELDQSQTVWQALDSLDEGNPLRFFRSGMQLLVKDEFAACIATLERGIALCGTESLNKDMRRAIQKARAALAAAGGPAVAAPVPAAVVAAPSLDNTQHVMLSRYQPPNGGKKIP